MLETIALLILLVLIAPWLFAAAVDLIRLAGILLPVVLLGVLAMVTIGALS